MLVCEGRVTTLWAWALANTRPAAARRSSVGVWRPGVLPAKPRRVGPQGVDGDQNDVGPLLGGPGRARRRGGAAAAAGEDREEERRENGTVHGMGGASSASARR